jgi:hypothetical protein
MKVAAVYSCAPPTRGGGGTHTTEALSVAGPWVHAACLGAAICRHFGRITPFAEHLLVGGKGHREAVCGLAIAE